VGAAADDIPDEGIRSRLAVNAGGSGEEML
jgi:hypothetical protein